MANTYSQIYIQIVFAVEGRQNLISPRNREELHKYITGIITARGQKLIAIFCMPDHVHILIAITPTIAISDLVRDIKAGSSNFINKNQWVRGRFNWQEGFGAFSYSRSQIDAVSKYILEQESRHADRSFKSEYLGLLDRFEVEYNEEYLFDWMEDWSLLTELRCVGFVFSTNRSPLRGSGMSVLVHPTNRPLLRSFNVSIFFVSTNRSPRWG